MRFGSGCGCLLALAAAELKLTCKDLGFAMNYAAIVFPISVAQFALN